MKNKLLTYLITVMFLLAVINPSYAEPDPEPQPGLALACLLVGGGILAGVGIYIVVKKCEPKYNCLKDEDGNYFLSTATPKEQALNDWTLVSGPYSSIAEGSTNCPPPVTNPTNPPPVTIQPPQIQSFSEPDVRTLYIQESSNMVHWTTVYQFTNDIYDVDEIYFPTNVNAAQMFYRASQFP